jgi:hypothetical protein
MMIENEGQPETLSDSEKPLAEQSPSEKLETETPISPATPGIENPDSEEIKQEAHPNTE